MPNCGLDSPSLQLCSGPCRHKSWSQLAGASEASSSASSIRIGLTERTLGCVMGERERERSKSLALSSSSAALPQSFLFRSSFFPDSRAADETFWQSSVSLSHLPSPLDVISEAVGGHGRGPRSLADKTPNILDRRRKRDVESRSEGRKGSEGGTINHR